MPPFVIAHISDLHLSTFGDTYHDRARIVPRGKEPIDATQIGKPLWSQNGWRVVTAIDKKKERLALLDPAGYEHPIPKVKSPTATPLGIATERARFLHERSARALAADLPTGERLDTLLAGTPRNSNLRLLQAVRAINRDAIDAVVITGDLTDDGDGWELCEVVFKKWIERGRLFVVPGNHDLYLFPIRGSGRPKPTHASKRLAWQAFAQRIGLSLDTTGAYYTAIPEADTVLLGLDSCATAQRRFYRHNGAIGEEQREYVQRIGRSPEWRAARHRIVLLHHHVVPLPAGVGRGSGFEIGMRLDDAKPVAKLFDEIGVNLVLHGHRHLSEQRQPAGSDFTILASPSFTLGCRSGDSPSYWRVELDGRRHIERTRVSLSALATDDDPAENC